MIDVPIAVKEALRDGRLKKNYRFLVLNDDGSTDFVIDNDYLVSESVSIDERMCSGDTLKFGLCEGSSLEFQYFNKMNITGRRLQAFVDVEYDNPVDIYEKIDDMVSDVETTITEGGDYRLYAASANAWSTTKLNHGGEISRLAPDSTANETIQILNGLDAWDSIEAQDAVDDVELQLKSIPKGLAWYSIPMGFFDVKKCSRQASTGIIKVTAYNKLQSDYLDAKANQVLLDAIASDTDVTVFDIRYLLLNDYKITENRASMGSVEYTTITVLESAEASFGTLKFNSLYGKKSPINACEFGISSTATTFQIRTYGDIIDYDLPAKCQIEARYGTLQGLENNVVQYLKKIVNDADLDQSWDDVLDYICTHGGFQKIIGIRDFNDNWYSTVQWNYEEAHSLTHTVAGKIADGQRLTTASDYLSVSVPKYISNGYSYPRIMYEGIIYTSSTVHRDYYEYYTDDTLTTKDTEPLQYLTFSEGTKYIYQSGEYQYAITAYEYTDISDADLIILDPETIPDFTLREIQSAVYETICQFGQLSRETDLFAGVELNYSRLYPANSLYPATDLYPDGAALGSFKSMYSKLWADEGNIRKWRYLYITFKGLDDQDQEKDYVLQKTINADGTDDYNMSDNWIFRNLIWTRAQIEDYADAMVPKMQDVTWFPFEMWCAGLPYLETGDEIEIPLNGVTYTSYILQRKLNGIQDMQDTYINGSLDIF